MATTDVNLSEQISNSQQIQENNENEESERLARIGELSPSVTGNKVDRKTISFEL